MVVLDTYFGLIGPPQQHVTQVIGWETWKVETHKEFTDQGLSAHLWFQSEDQMVFFWQQLTSPRRPKQRPA